VNVDTEITVIKTLIYTRPGHTSGTTSCSVLFVLGRKPYIFLPVYLHSGSFVRRSWVGGCVGEGARARPSPNTALARQTRARRLAPERVGEVTPTRAAFVDIDREQVTEVMHGARAEDADGAASGARGAAP
jgi:hypothetical protein